MRCTIPAAAVLLTILSGPTSRADEPTRGPIGDVELLRDQWGIPHVFAETDAGAMYGLGWATAEDRGFQMYYTLRIIQGRLAETVGDVPHLRRRNESAVSHDRKMRTFGFATAAEETARSLDDESRALLQAYADGVNAYFHANRDDLHGLFGELELKIEPWTVADCILSWWHFAQFFATDGTRDLIAWRNQFNPPADRAERGAARRAPRQAPRREPDDAVAVVKREDVSDAWLEQIDRFLADHGHADAGQEAASERETPKFSHAWVVGGRRSTTGSSILISDPQTPVRNPSLLYEFHISGASFNARGVGVAGSPIILIGFSEQVAWGMTALGADQADLFRLKTDQARPDQYLLNGEWREMQVHEEIIKVKGGKDRAFKVRTTVFGPVVTAFAFVRPGESDVALKRVPMCDTEHDTMTGALAMMRAQSASEFGKALAGWRFPSANVLFGDVGGDIGYSCVGALPLRSSSTEGEGRRAHDGSRSENDWATYVPHHLLPHVSNPDAGLIFSANHRPIQSFYKVPIGISTGSLGDTDRSWRLRELLSRPRMFSPEDVLDVHRDTVNPARRDIVRLGYFARTAAAHAAARRDTPKLSKQSLRALEYLEDWYAAGARSDLRVPGAELAIEINTFFRTMATDLAYEYGGGQSGLSRMLRTVTARTESHPAAGLTDNEFVYIDEALAGAWRACQGKYGVDPAQWNARARRAVMRRSMGYGESLDGFPPLVRDRAVRFPALFCVDGGTIQSQAAQAYTQFVSMADVDAAMSLLPPGQSERFDHSSRLSTLELWGRAELHPAPLSRNAVERLTVSRSVLSPG